MKKHFSMIAMAIASVLAFSSCHSESTDIVDPLAGKHEVEATIHAEVSGAFTKAVAIEVEYKDFKGETHKEVVNGNFDGKDAVFDKTIRTVLDGTESEAAIRFRGIKGNADNYKTAVSPWGIKCTAVAKLDGNQKASFYYDGSVTEPDKPILESYPGVTWGQKDNAYLSGVKYLEDIFTKDTHDKDLIIKVGKTDVTFTNWPSK